MARIDELAKKYPDIPRDLIVKWELWNRGVKDTDDLDKISIWKVIEGSYQNKFDEVTLKDLVARRPSRVQGDRILRPDAFFMKSSFNAPLVISPGSPYSVREVSENKFGLFEDEEQVDLELYFPMPKPREGAEPLTSRGTPISRLIKSPRSCFFIFPVRYCEYFATGDQCKFCNFNVGQEDARAIGLDRPVSENLEDTVEAYKIRTSEVRIVEGHFELGGFTSSDHEERIHTSFVEKIANATSYKPNLSILTEALSRKGLQRLKDVGLDSMHIQMEVWDRVSFDASLPGKGKHCSYDRWLEFVSESVDILGKGNVACKTIGGISLVAGAHQTWQEARDTHIDHIREMTKIGVLPSIGCLRLPVGSVWGDDHEAALRKKLPPTEYYLDLFGPHDEAMEADGMYEKLNKLMYCGLDCCHSLYAGDVGIFKKAGDWGHYMQDTVPDKVNWTLHWLKEIQEKAAVSGTGQ
ncbi:MAG: hypothetical protein Q7O66_04480 [Dehalococcoidia bacterium]|nr:hypothetical protein [Dehalococcoidia bacterium]